MEIIYDLTNESPFYMDLMCKYIHMASENNINTTWASYPPEKFDCYELLRFATHHAKLGESVYLIGFPKTIPVLERPDTLFFLEKWSDFLDISDLDSALALAVHDRNKFDYNNLNKTYNHIVNNFKSFVSISFNK